MDLAKDTNPIETNSQTPPQPIITNGSLNHHHPTTTTTVSPPSPPPSTAVSYKECLKNHAASIGGHALDGCGEFMPSSSSNPNEPRSLTCAACGCHRNFHRHDTQEHHHRHSNPRPNFLSFYHSPLPSHRGPGRSSSPSPISSPSPPPISHHFPPSSHHFQGLRPAHGLLGHGNEHQHHHHHLMSLNFVNSSSHTDNNHYPSAKKRNRTKFSHEQKQKMQNFAEKLGWRLHKGDEGLVQDFCEEIGVSRGVFKVWMHNNKNTCVRKRSLEPGEKINGTGSDSTNNHDTH